MTKDEIIGYAGEIEKSIQKNIVDSFDANNEVFASLSHYVRQFENRSKEYHHPSFVVLVVGPVKSGKSTFVNLVAKNYVSPTHFLECTVRPSIISKKNCEESYLEVYESCDPTRKSEQMDDILDFLNGLIEKQEIKDVKVKQREFSRTNIDKYVKRSMVEVQGDEILLTAIHTEGGKLLQDNVLLFDMAGFDGANVNFESPAYKAIVQRADLIIFVQSSNSAISKVSSEFFNLLKKTNNSVPVCLVHNVFEAAYWRTDAQKRQDIEIQKEHAIDVIRDTYKLTLEANNAFNLNLGKVNDLREKNYEVKDEATLVEEAAKFEKAEEEMYRLFERRECIRLKNCITRTKIHKEKLLGAINSLQRERDQLREEYEAVERNFEGLKKTENDMSLTIGGAVLFNELTNLVEREYNRVKEFDVTAHKYKTDEARMIVHKFLDNVRNEMNEYLHSKLNEAYSSMRRSVELHEWLATINNTVLEDGIVDVTGLNINLGARNITYDLETMVENKVKQKRFWFKHSIDEMNEYLVIFKKILLGSQDEYTKVKVDGYVERNIYVEMQSVIKESIANMKSSVITYVNGEIESKKKMALGRIIPDIKVFDHDSLVLTELRVNVENLNIMEIV